MSRRISSLDGLRALSITAVLFGHLAGTRGAYTFAKGSGIPEDFAGLGVTVFFVISGFLITTLLLDEERRNGAVSLSNFYARRAVRIVPPFLAFVAAMTAAYSLRWVDFTRLDFATAITWTMNYNPHPAWVFGHLWSLSVEEQFYLLWPLTIALLGFKRGRHVAIGMFLAAPVVRAAMRVALPHSSLRWLPVFPAVADAI
ncbi:MAG: acyltransferase, partial [Steroidobacteraceae bacterium]